MSNGTNANIDSWEDFLGNWFKADHVKEWPAVIVVVNVTGEIDVDGDASLVLDIQYNQKKLKFQINKTNQGIIKEQGIPSPRALIGKKITFKKVMNYNPTIKKRVPSLEIEKIE